MPPNIIILDNNKSWKENIQQLTKDLVPEFGEADTLQGELVRGIHNLG